MSADRVVAFIGLGSNLEQPERQVLDAFDELNALPLTEMLRHSRLYRSPPLGPAGQPDYVNAVAMLRTGLSAPALMAELQAIERVHGRVRGVRWGPRTLDLDLLLYADQLIDTPQLQVPHPQMHRRAFVLLPLHEIAADLHLPGLGPLAELVRRVDAGPLRPLEGEDGD